MMQVTLCCAPAPRQVHEEALCVPEGCTLEAAVAASGLARRFPALDWRTLHPGVWGRAADWTRPLADGDRIELCRPLTVDPKVARRERFQRQGARTAGLFARRRDGAKAGY